MSGVRLNISGLPITLMEAKAVDDIGKELFSVPKILVFHSKETVNMGIIGSREVKKIFNFEQVQGYIPSVYGKQAFELDLCVHQLLIKHKEINIVGYLKNRAVGQLIGVLIDSSLFHNDENGPHTGWIKVIARDYRVEPVKK